MRLPPAVSCLLVLAATIVPARAQATEIAGKWGFGLSIGDLLDSHAEASIIRGTSSSTAWALDLNMTGSIKKVTFSSRYNPSAPNEEQDRIVTAAVGPRLRHFTRPDRNFSPYADLFAHGIYGESLYREYGQSKVTRGLEMGVDLGAEYFFSRWPLSAAVHTGFFSVHYTHDDYGVPAYTSDYPSKVNTLSGSLSLSPALQIRAYF